ncbi:penicillin acylase family protein [Streptomyces sp. NPDC056975]|uniref:penicillin acylase family protein n=1 Tax=Streptomyces sp. NPDC056975 TaxID=3345985 RepID=UPI003625FD6A
MKALDAIAVPFAGYAAYHGGALNDWYGAERVGRMFAHRSFLDAGVTVAGSSDYPCGPYQPLIGLQSMVTREGTDDGAAAGPGQRVSAEEALRIFTLGSAEAEGTQAYKGRLAAGQLADFLALGENPLTADPHGIASIPVRATYVGGDQVYAAPDGTVGWRPAGRVPVRPNWDGTLPVPGDGRYEWDGFLDADALPAERDPDQGWFATANQMNLPPGYPNDRDTVTYDWYAPTRHHRIAEELDARADWTVEDCVRLQTDTVSLPARRILPLLAGLTGDNPLTERAVGLLREWDADITADSAAAALFEIWYRRHLRPAVFGKALREVGPEAEHAAALARILPPDDPASDPRVDLDLLTGPETGLDPGTLLATLSAAAGELSALLGPDPAAWTWGALHDARVYHPVTALHDGPQPPWASVGPAPCGGSADTVGVAPYGPDFRQTTGATFRLVVDVGSWDDSVAMNSPGQSGNPDSEHYSDLFATWAADGSFPLLYSREQVEKHTARTITLRPPAPATAQDPNGR